MFYLSYNKRQAFKQTDRLTTAERVKIIKIDYKNDDSNLAMFRTFRESCGAHNRPITQAIDIFF